MANFNFKLKHRALNKSIIRCIMPYTVILNSTILHMAPTLLIHRSRDSPEPNQTAPSP